MVGLSELDRKDGHFLFLRQVNVCRGKLAVLGWSIILITFRNLKIP